MTAPRPTSTPLRTVLLLLAVLVAVACAYSGALGGGFVWDDHPLIEQQPLVTSLHPLRDYFLRMFWADPLSLETRNFYRPLTTLSYALDHAWGGGAPWAFHATNLLLHLGCVALLFALARKLGASDTAAALGAAVWGLQPRLTESVAWISGRTDVLAALGVLAALVLWTSAPEAWLRRVCAALALLAGLFSKEVAIAAFVGLVGWELAARRQSAQPWSRTVRNLVPLALVVAVYAALRMNVPQTSTITHDLGAKRIAAAFEAFGTYGLMVVDAFRPRLQIGLLGVPSWPKVALGVALALAVLVLAVRALRKGPSPRAVLLTLTSLVAIALVLHLVPLAVNVVAADRFLYVPTIGVALALALWITKREETRRPVEALVPLLVCVLLAAVTYGRGQEWANELRLWSAAKDSSHPLNPMPYLNLGYAFTDRNMPSEALEAYREATARMAKLDEVRGLASAENEHVLKLNMSLTLQKLGRYDEAERMLSELVRELPSYKKARYAQVRLALRRLRIDDAQRLLDETQRSLGTDGAATELGQLLVRARETLAQLPPESANEDVGTVARRAELFDTIGAEFEARTCWHKVLDTPGAPPELVGRAAGYLAFQGTPAEAQRAVAQLVARTGSGGLVDQLSAEVDDRMREVAEAQ